ncbi:hypothetical protein OCU04_004419 [Sclerotinia nivalis]|uniref:Uncharacterized protein n=1 Tax=Sclerotinia nivalis TaxID=352851 RepID=A0A9X0DL39_9HELO|nr:hypothetical protein OCU04_004419 [Sclerotinia nivalis]
MSWPCYAQNIVTTDSGDYRIHNEIITIDLIRAIQYTPPPSIVQPAISSLPTATSFPSVSLPSPSIISQYTGVSKRTNPALDCGQIFRRVFDFTYGDEEGLERSTRLRKYTNENIHSSSKRTPRIKSESGSNSRSYIRDIPEFRSSRERSSSGSRAYL